MILRVWTHWLAAPPAPPSAPTARPASLSGYTGTVTQLPITGAAPQFSTDWIITPVVAVWAELATQDDIYVAGWGGPGWPGAPPPAGDEGYSTAAGTFKVTGVSVIMDIANTEFTFTIRTPAGNVVGTITPASPAAMPGMYPVTLPGGGPIIPVPNGKGIWTVEIQRIAGSGQNEPALYLGRPGNPVQPTYVSPYGNLYEGILGLAFEGEEVFCPTKSLTAEVENTPGAWAGRASLTGVNCVTVGQNIRLTAIYATPTPAAGTDYMWEFGDQSVVPNTQHPVNSQVHGYARADSYAAGVTLNIPGCSTLLTKPVDVCWACPTKVEVHLLHKKPHLKPLKSPGPWVVMGCAPGSAAATFKVVVTWPPGPQPGPADTKYAWVITGPTGKFELTTDVPNVSTGNMNWKKTSVSPNVVGVVDLDQPGAGYSVSVTVVADFSSSCIPEDNHQFEVLPCVPPTVQPSCSLQQGVGNGSVSVTFDQDVDKASAEDPTNYNVGIGGAPGVMPAANSISYDAATKIATISGLTINPGNSVVVSITGVKSTKGAVMTAPGLVQCAAPPAAPSTTPTTTTTTGTATTTFGCAFLLVLAIILLALGSVLLVLGICIAVPWVWIVGIIVAAVGLILFIIWAILCSMLTPCALMRTIQCIIAFCVGVVFPILAIVLWFFGGLPCGLAAALAWGGWAALCYWLRTIMRGVGCPPTC